MITHTIDTVIPTPFSRLHHLLSQPASPREDIFLLPAPDDLFRKMINDFAREELKKKLPITHYMTFQYIISRYDKVYKSAKQHKKALAAEYIAEADAACKSLPLEQLSVIHAYSLHILSYYHTRQGEQAKAEALLEEALLADDYMESEIGNTAWHLHKVYIISEKARYMVRNNDPEAGMNYLFEAICYLRNARLPSVKGNWNTTLLSAIPASASVFYQVSLLHDAIGILINAVFQGDTETADRLFRQYFTHLAASDFLLGADALAITANNHIMEWKELLCETQYNNPDAFVDAAATVLGYPKIFDRFKLFYLWRVLQLAQEKTPGTREELTAAAMQFLQENTELNNRSIGILSK